MFRMVVSTNVVVGVVVRKEDGENEDKSSDMVGVEVKVGVEVGEVEKC